MECFHFKRYVEEICRCVTHDLIQITWRSSDIISHSHKNDYEYPKQSWIQHSRSRFCTVPRKELNSFWKTAKIMDFFQVLFIFALALVFSSAKRDHPVPTYFGYVLLNILLYDKDRMLHIVLFQFQNISGGLRTSDIQMAVIGIYADIQMIKKFTDIYVDYKDTAYIQHKKFHSFFSGIPWKLRHCKMFIFNRKQKHIGISGKQEDNYFFRSFPILLYSIFSQWK